MNDLRLESVRVMSSVFHSQLPLRNEDHFPVIYLIKVIISNKRCPRGRLGKGEILCQMQSTREGQREKILSKGEHGSQAGRPQFFDSRPGIARATDYGNQSKTVMCYPR